MGPNKMNVWNTKNLIVMKEERSNKYMPWVRNNSMVRSNNFKNADKFWDRKYKIQICWKWNKLEFYFNFNNICEFTNDNVDFFGAKTI